jgi:FemAB-related protein (PEP-CTERM system-associated)
VTDLWAWRDVVREAYGMSTHFALARDAGTVRGALGLVEVRHAVFGRYLTTAAFGSDGGFFADDDAARDALATHAAELARRRGVEHVVVRSRDHAIPSWRVDDHYHSAVVDLADGLDAAWARLPAATRNQVRRGQRERFTVDAGPDQLEPFVGVFHEHMRDLGSPAHGTAYYRVVQERLRGRHEFLVVRDGRSVVAGALLTWVNGTAANIHTVALRRYNTRCPNSLLYWTMMQRAAALGCRAFDMGRSEAGGPNMRFKRNWAPHEVVLHYSYHLEKGDSVPYVDPRNPKYRLAIAAWQRLPVALTRRLGPLLIRGLA